jgi:hypothetical protein
MIFAGETEVLGENLPSATLSTTNPTWIDPGSNPGLHGERPATNRLSHGTASGQSIKGPNKATTQLHPKYKASYLIRATTKKTLVYEISLKSKVVM